MWSTAAMSPVLSKGQEISQLLSRQDMCVHVCQYGLWLGPYVDVTMHEDKVDLLEGYCISIWLGPPISASCSVISSVCLFRRRAQMWTDFMFGLLEYILARPPIHPCSSHLSYFLPVAEGI